MAEELVLTAAVAAELAAEAARAAPLEACGLLGGRDGRVTMFVALTNADASAEHFSMLPEEQFRAVRRMREAGLKMLGIWHSHPASPARMSQEDLRLACTPEVLYVISSLMPGANPALAAFAAGDGSPRAVPVQIEG